MRRLFVALSSLTGCVESPAPRLSPDASYFDAARPDASSDGSLGDATLDASTDGSDATVDADADAATDAGADAGFDAGSDAGTPSYCSVSSTVVLTTVPTAQALEPAWATTGNQLVVAWVASRGGQSDVFTRPVPATGPAGAELQVTADVMVEGSPSLAPSETGMILAYTRGSGTGSDILTASFDPLTASLGGLNEITSDVFPDAFPVLTPTATGALLHFERTVDFGSGPSPAYFAEELSVNGAPASGAYVVSTTRTLAGPIAIDATSTDPRLYYRAAATTLGSIQLTALGVEMAPDAGETLVPMPGALMLGTRIRTTPSDASPRVVLTEATSGTRRTAMLQRMTATGSRTGNALELTSVRSVVSPSVTVFDGYAVIAYRSGTASAGEVRLALLRANGTFAGDFAVTALASIDGSLEVVTLADGSRMDLVLDDVSGANRELRVLRLSCALP